MFYKGACKPLSPLLLLLLLHVHTPGHSSAAHSAPLQQLQIKNMTPRLLTFNQHSVTSAAGWLQRGGQRDFLFCHHWPWFPVDVDCS